jgi:hypothetical protein
LVENRLRKHLPEEKATYHKEKQNRRTQASTFAKQNKTSELSGDEKHRKWRKDARSIIGQARINKA